MDTDFRWIIIQTIFSPFPAAAGVVAADEYLRGGLKGSGCTARRYIVICVIVNACYRVVRPFFLTSSSDAHPLVCQNVKRFLERRYLDRVKGNHKSLALLYFLFKVQRWCW